MQVEIGIIGVPRGFCSSPELKQKSYSQSLLGLYNPSTTKSEKQMRIVKNSDGHVVYAYTIGSADGFFLADDGRSNSFFGMVIALKDYQFTNLEKLYQVLDFVYENSIKGKIISDDGKNRKHLLSYAEFGSIEIQEKIGNVISNEINNKMVRGDIVSFKYNANEPRVLSFKPHSHSVTNTKNTSELTITQKNKTSKYDKAIATLQQMGISPEELVEYINNKKQNG